MRILITRHKEGSLGYYIKKILEARGHKVEVLLSNIDSSSDKFHLNLGGFDRVINVAGITLNQPVEEFDMEETKRLFSCNVLGAMNLTTAYAKERGNDGAIFHTGSIGGRKVMTNCSAYSASKAALAHYTHCAGYELKDYIPVVSIDPPNLLGTPMTKSVQEGLINNRGMSDEQVAKIYSDAADPIDVATMYADIVCMPLQLLKLISGENIVLGKSDHR